MLQSEFTDLTDIDVTPSLFAEIHEMYMASDLDKDAWCKQYKRKCLFSVTHAMAKRIAELEEDLRQLLQVQERERRHADKELLDARKTGNAYAEELIRIYDVKGDDKAMREMLAKVRNKYNNK